MRLSSKFSYNIIRILQRTGLLVFCYSVCFVCDNTLVLGQAAVVSKVVTTNYPTLSLSLYAFNKDARQIALTTSDRRITENTNRQVIGSIINGVTTVNSPYSLVVACGLSSEKSIASARIAINTWKDAIINTNSEIALSAFSDRSMILQDFTTDTTRLTQASNRLEYYPTLSFTNALCDSLTGAFAIARRGIHQRVVVVVTDAIADVDSARIVRMATESNTIVCFIIVDAAATNTIFSVARLTGTRINGVCFDNISINDIRYITTCLRAIISGAQPSIVTWLSNISSCSKRRKIQIDLQSIGIEAQTDITIPDESLPLINAEPTVLDIGVIPINRVQTLSQIWRIPAAPVFITSITSPYPLFALRDIAVNGNSVSLPTTLQQNDVVVLQYDVTVNDAIQRRIPIEVNGQSCINGQEIAIHLGVRSFLSNRENIALTFPQPGMRLLGGIDTVITWTGTDSTDLMILDYSVNNGQSWTIIDNSVRGNFYRWNVPSLRENITLRIRGRQQNSALMDWGNLVENITISSSALSVNDTANAGRIALGEFGVARSRTALCNATSSPIIITGVSSESPDLEVLSIEPTTLGANQCATVTVQITSQHATSGIRHIVVKTTDGGVRLPIQYSVVPRRITVAKVLSLDSIALGITRDSVFESALCISSVDESYALGTSTILTNDNFLFTLPSQNPLILSARQPCVSPQIRFTAEYNGRTSTVVRIRPQSLFEESYSLSLYAEGVCNPVNQTAFLSIPDTTLRSGSSFRLPLLYVNTPLEFTTMKRPFRVTLRVTASMILPQGNYTSISRDGDSYICIIEGRGFLSGDTLAFIEGTVAWGSEQEARIMIIGFVWLDDCTQPPAREDGIITISDLCRVGGTRLFLLTDTLRFNHVYPNPTNDGITVGFTLREDGLTTLEVVDMLGRTIHTFVHEFLSSGSYEYSTFLSTAIRKQRNTSVDQKHIQPDIVESANIPTGQYILVLTTPTKQLSTIFGVVR